MAKAMNCSKGLDERAVRLMREHAGARTHERTHD